MSACPQCGQENKEGARFCIKCGAGLEAPAPTAAPPPTPPPQAAQPTYQQPAQYTQPTPAPGAYQQQAYGAPPAAPYPAAYAPAPTYAAGSKSNLFWVGALIMLVSGILILVSAFMPWFLGATGWDGVTYSSGFAKLFDYGDGYPIFTGLSPLILGALIALVAALVLAFRNKGLAAVGIILSILALGVAITNLTTIVRLFDFGNMQVGMYLFLIFSITGLVGSGMAASG